MREPWGGWMGWHGGWLPPCAGNPVLWRPRAFLREYDLSTQEGVALMCLAEALLRIPDAETADRLIRDKMAARLGAASGPQPLAVRQRLDLGADADRPHGGLDDETTQCRRRASSAWSRALRRAGDPRWPCARRCGIMGQQFVMGRTIDEALERARRRETARAIAIPSTCWARRRAPPPTPSATSSPTRDAIARHRPRSRRRADRRSTAPASRSSSRRCIRATKRRSATRVMARTGCRAARPGALAKAHDIGFTIDAEEADRLDCRST